MSLLLPTLPARCLLGGTELTPPTLGLSSFLSLATVAFTPNMATSSEPRLSPLFAAAPTTTAAASLTSTPYPSLP